MINIIQKLSKHNIRNNSLLLLSIAAASLLLPSCHHKDLEFDIVDTQSVNVEFDWRNAPDANPASMGLFLYYSDADLENPSILFEFPNKVGGEIKIPVGNFSGIAFNTDNTDWVIMNNEESLEDFEITTHNVSSLTKIGPITRAIPRPVEAQTEPVKQTPGMVWSAREDGMSLSINDKAKTLTFYPEEAVCHYTVDVVDVDNIQSIEGSTADATISGMAGGYSHGKGRATSTKVTHPFTLTVDTSKKSLHSEFLTFGEPYENAGSHYISLYLILDDGSKNYYECDVTDQIRNASDPHHVHIVIQGPHLPKAISNEGGLIPNVDDWTYENIDLKM